MTSKRAPDVCTIPSGVSFADALAAHIMTQAGSDPLALTNYTVLLPSRRACRTVRDAFLRLSGGKAALMPTLHPVGEADAEETSLLLASHAASEMLDLPPAVSRLERQLLLARAIGKTGMTQSFDQAAALALELGRFLDEVQTEGLSFNNLATLVPEEFASHWQKTLSFLKILTAHWPDILQERGVIDYADRRTKLLQAELRAWEKFPPQHPVIAAGSTGTVPAVADILTLVATLPQGMLVLPGLDVDIDDISWSTLGEDHPQHGMKKLLDRIGVERKAVKILAKSPRMAREKLLSEAMRPAETTESWRALTPKDIPSQALEGLARIDCATAQEEASVIALLMREALETSDKTCALVTPDRRLARRVALALKRWGIDVNDSGGQPLTELDVGVWLMLVAEAAEEALSPVLLLSLLKRPLIAAGIASDDMRDMVRLLDRLVLRGPRPAPGFEGIAHAIQALHDALPKAPLLSWLKKIESVAGSFVRLMSEDKERPFRDLLQAHIRAAEDLAATTETSGADRLWRDEGGEEAASFLTELMQASTDVPAMTPEHYVSLLGLMLKGVAVRPRFGAHPRLSILGQIEARLYSTDMAILGGLNENTWPALPAHDPWMSRPMRKKFGLPAPEHHIGLSAHDFVQAAGAKEVIFTRAEKIDGAPTVPARWLLRLETVLASLGMELPKRTSAQYRYWARLMDVPADIRAITRPAPTPPVSARPRRLSVTTVERWMRDPYQIYAEHVLKLPALDPVDADPGAAERGTFVHEALDKFIKTFQDNLPPDAEEKLLAMGREAIVRMRVPPEVEAFWWPRFERIAAEFVRQERLWRLGADPFLTETKGNIALTGFDGGDFTLTAKADRIDKIKSGGFAVIDYKSGHPPSPKEVKAGMSPQLPLEALMLQEDGFGKLDAIVNDIVYWKVTGGGALPVERKSLTETPEEAQALINEAEAGLRSLISAFDDPATPYLSEPSARTRARFTNYAHLARVKEWGVQGDDEEEAE